MSTTSTTDVTTTAVSPYGAAKLVSGWLKTAGVEKDLPPQMFYNYTTARIRAGKAPYIEVDEQGKITVEALATWFVKYAERKGLDLSPKVEEATEVEEEGTEVEETEEV